MKKMLCRAGILISVLVTMLCVLRHRRKHYGTL